MKALNISDESSVRAVELNRSEALNALDGQMTDDLADTFMEAAEDPTVKVLLMTGADLKEMGRKTHVSKPSFGSIINIMNDFPKPFIVAVNGRGVGIGATICGLADLVYMSERSMRRRREWGIEGATGRRTRPGLRPCSRHVGPRAGAQLVVLPRRCDHGGD